MPKFEEMNDESDLAAAFAKRQGEDNGKMIGDILEGERMKDAEKFPHAKEMIESLQFSLDAMPKFGAEDLSQFADEAAAKAAKSSPTPSRDFLDNGFNA